jgi:AcrR family transcriptional regulator
VNVKTRTRKYELKKRAQRQDETRQRIVEAAVALHEQLGPSQTSISAIAERAGVGRPTVYRHFPDERSLYTACTSHYLAQHQPPDSVSWRDIADPAKRLRFGLLETYRWYRETEQMTTVMYRDLPEEPELAAVLEPLFAELADAHAVLVEGWATPAPALLRAAVGHALAFSTWRSLAGNYRLSDEIVADLLTAMIVSSVPQETPLSFS